MAKRQIVADINVFVTALRSQFGASYKLFSLIDEESFQLNISVPLALEYEAVAKRQIGKIALSERERENISINQLITLALAEKLAVLGAEDYLEERAKRGSKTKFRKALAKVPKVPPPDYDRL